MKVATEKLDLDGFVLLARIGEGPGAATYSALDRRDGRKVIVRQASGGTVAADALLRERTVLSKVRHPNMVRLIDSGERDGIGYSVLAREEGVSLNRLPAAWRAAMGQRTLIELLDPLLEALEEVHGAGFLHGDLSPGNILLRPDGQPLLLDFESAAPLAAAPGESGPAAATPGFAAPERGTGDSQGPWTDVYALAAVAYWLIVGRAPQDDGAGDASLARAAAGDKRYSPEFLGAIDVALSDTPEARPASAADWREALASAAEAERPDAPSLVQLAAAIQDEDDIDLPPADDVPPTALLPRQALIGEGRQRVGGSARDAETAPRRRVMGGLPAALVLVLLAGAAGAAGWWGWTWYSETTKKEWLVDPAGGGDALSVGDAVARAPAGATIRIRPGTYAESLTLRRPVHLEAVAEDGAEVVISPISGSCLVVDAPSGSVRGLAFNGGDGAAPCLEIASGTMEVVGNRLGPWSGTALLIRDGAAPVIRDNIFADIDGTAIVVAGQGGGFIEANQIERTTKSAVRVEAGADPTVRGNRIHQAGQAGLLIDQGALGLYSENEITESGASAIEVRGGAVPKVSANRIEGAAQAGLFIHEGARGVYQENVIQGSKMSGVVIASGAAPLVSNNEIAGGEQHGILVVVGGGGRIVGNRITKNSGHAIVLGGAGEVVMEDNELKGNRRPQVRRSAQ